MRPKIILVIFALVGVLTVAMVVAFLWVLSVQRSIQTERRDSIIAACLDQNHRHDASLAYLRRLGDQIEKKDPAKTKSVETGIARYKLLFDALAPKRDCHVLADKFVSQGG